MKRICLLNGRHTPGTDWARECPLRNAAERSARARRAAQVRYASRQQPVEQRVASDQRPAAPGTVVREQRAA